jgi:penicillin amidase
MAAGPSYPFYLSTLWEPPYRAMRIADVLGPAEQSGVDDFKQLQQDNVSYHSRELTPHILRAFADDSTDETPAHHALEYLRNWDFRCSQEDIATSIFNVFFVRLLHNTFEDEMGSGLFGDFIYYSGIPYRAMSGIIRKDSSAWFDDVRTARIESRDDIIRASFHDALNELAGRFGQGMKTWRWGAMHQVHFSHPFGERAPLELIFNNGPFPIGGIATTVNKADYKLGSPYNFFSGPSMRQIVDLADPSTAYMVLPLGQSGQPLQDHFDDQTTFWLKGGYRTTTLDMEKVRNTGWRKLILTP